ncbi:F-box/LRR-repeat protein [Apostasia shenzhenica]|uniref:F-box/LRR-repeat protein n=1 Tax=Apostasia shenzhenica TaxID=1088818 RepID=A0A2I0AN87_9ASPA|nr:F-box/LRR-repeat protein [Apostasia shenzhenica]
MPTDCLAVIFSKLSLLDLTTAVPFVCKAWLQASSDPQCWKVLDFRISFPVFFNFALNRSRGAAVELRFPSHVSPSPEDLSLASQVCPGLKIVSLPRMGVDDEGHVLNLVERWKQLEVLEMESKPSVLPEMVKKIGLHCPNFHGLKLRGLIKKEDVAAIICYLPKLQQLDLSCCRLGREQLVSLVEGCRELKRLMVCDCVGFEADEEVKRKASGMEVFEHGGSRIEDDCEYDESVDEVDALEQMFMYYDDCYVMWLL